MFWLVDMKDTVRLPPHLFKLQHNDAIIECLNKKFANKVVVEDRVVSDRLARSSPRVRAPDFKTGQLLDSWVQTPTASPPDQG